MRMLACLLTLASISATPAATLVQMPEAFRLPAPLLTNYIAMGSDVSISRSWCAVGAPGYDISRGAVFLYQKRGTNYVPAGLLQPTNLSAVTRFGWSASINEDTLAAGTMSDNDPGSVYVYRCLGTNWASQARLTPWPAPAAADGFGSDVSVDGNTIAVGARLDNNRRGAAYVFVRQGTNWVQQARLLPDAAPAGAAEFGEAVSLHGSNLVIGASWQGRTYVFNRQGTNWVKQAVLTSPTPAGYFGAAVSIRGNILAIGNRLSTNSASVLCGSVFVYGRLATNWVYQARLNPSDAVAGQDFGSGVAVFGSQILVGSAKANTPNALAAGAAYLYTRVGLTWVETSKFARATGSVSNDFFAYSVALWGNHLVMGGAGDDVQGIPDVGAAFAVDARRAPPGNYFGTDRADYALLEPAPSAWFLYSLTLAAGVGPIGFGWAETEPVPGDYDGDGTYDIAVFHRARGDWYLQRSSLGFTGPINFGWAETEPVPQDYDGDGVTDLAVFHRARGDWYLLRSSLGFTGPINFGWAETEPVPEDYDGDGRADLAVFHRARGDWYLSRSSLGFTGPVNFGWAQVTPVAADYDGDRKADLAVFDPARADWYLLQTRDGFLGPFQFGNVGGLPVPADYSGDGRVDPCLYDPATWSWTWLNGARGQPVGPTRFGNASVRPVPP